MATATPRIAAGATLRCADGRLILLGREVKRGGAGTVHLLPQAPQQVAKIYHPGTDLARAERKLAAMLALSPELPDITEHGRRYVQIAWPQAALHDDAQGFVGFLMPALDLKLTSELECILQERQARKLSLPTGLGARITLAANLAAVVAELHRRRHRVIDLKPVNLRFYPSSLYMAVLDCDGFAIAGATERFPAEQVTPDYLAPELQRRALDADDEESQDRFALAVMAFQLINHGIHPYAGKPLSERVPTDLPGRIAGGYYAYGLQPHAAIAATPGSSHELIPSPLREAFDRSFSKTATTRVAAAEWRDLLRDYATRSAGRLVVCSRHPEHQHFAGYDCGSCRRAERIREARTKPAARRDDRATMPSLPAAPGPIAARRGAANVARPIAVPTGATPSPLAIAAARRRARPPGVLKVRALTASGAPAPPPGARTSPPPQSLFQWLDSQFAQLPAAEQARLVAAGLIGLGLLLTVFIGATSPGSGGGRSSSATTGTAAQPPSTVPKFSVAPKVSVQEALALKHLPGWRRDLADLGDDRPKTSLRRVHPAPVDRIDTLVERFLPTDLQVLTVGSRLPVGTTISAAWYQNGNWVAGAERTKLDEGYFQYELKPAATHVHSLGPYRMILFLNGFQVQSIDFDVVPEGTDLRAPVASAPAPGGTLATEQRRYGQQLDVAERPNVAIRLQPASCTWTDSHGDHLPRRNVALESICFEVVGALPLDTQLEVQWTRANFAPLQRASVEVIHDSVAARRLVSVDVGDGPYADYLASVNVDGQLLRQMWLRNR